MSSVTTESPRAKALEGMRAGFATRVIAASIDVVVVFVALLAVLGGYAVVDYLVTSNPLELPDLGAVWSGAAFTVLLVTVLTVAWCGSGRTLGNAFMGLRVLTESGKRPTWRRALLRGRDRRVHPRAQHVVDLGEPEERGAPRPRVPHHGRLRLAAPA